MSGVFCNTKKRQKTHKDENPGISQSGIETVHETKACSLCPVRQLSSCVSNQTVSSNRQCKVSPKWYEATGGTTPHSDMQDTAQIESVEAVQRFFHLESRSLCTELVQCGMCVMVQGLCSGDDLGGCNNVPHCQQPILFLLIKVG